MATSKEFTSSATNGTVLELKRSPIKLLFSSSTKSNAITNLFAIIIIGISLT
nr:MAG TPA: hypothetical protein [Caudoviricetes sp.]